MPFGKKISPVLLVALGEYGIEIAENCYNHISNSYHELSMIVKGIIINSSGSICPITQMDSPIFTLNLNISDDNPNPYESISNSFIQNKNNVADIIADQINHLLTGESLQSLEENGFEVSRNTQILIFSAAFDLIASSITLPLLELFQVEKKQGRISNGDQVSLFVVLPNLSKTQETSKQRIEMARTYKYFCELDYSIDHSRKYPLEPNIDIKLIWLLGCDNMKGAHIGNLETVKKAVANIVESLVAYRILSDYSFIIQLENKKLQNKYCPYSSFGSSSLIFPEKEALVLLTYYSEMKLLDPFIESINKIKYDRSMIFAKCRDFLYNNDLLDVVKRLSKNVDGKEIYQQLFYSIPQNPKTFVKNFVEEIEEKFRSYSEEELNKYTIKLSEQSKSLFEKFEQDLLNQINMFVDHEENGLGYISAFLHSLYNQDSSYLKGDSLELKYTIDEVERNVNTFYRKILGLDSKEDKLHRIEEDIKSKDRLIENFNKELSHKKELKKASESFMDAEKIKIEKEQIIKNIENIHIQREELSTSYDLLKLEVEKLLMDIKDPTRRRQLKENEEAEEDRLIKEAINNVELIDTELKQTHSRFSELVELHKIYIKRLFVYIPIGGIGLALLSLFTFLFFGLIDVPEIVFLFITNAVVLSIIIIIYCGLAYLIYNKKVGWEYQTTKQKIPICEDAKRGSMGRLINSYNHKSMVTWTHLLNNSALEWVQEMCERVFTIMGSIDEFIRQLYPAFTTICKNWEDTNLPSSLLSRSVLNKNDIINVYNSKILSIKKYFMINPLSSYINSHIKGKGNTLLEDLGQYILTEYDFFRNANVENFIFSNINSIQTVASIFPEKRFQALYDSAAPLCQLEIVAEHEKPEEKVILCVQEKDETKISKVTKEGIIKANSIYSTGNKNLIEINRFLFGFPAYQLHQLKYTRECYVELSKKEGCTFSINHDANELYSPFPSESISEETVNDDQKLLYQALLLGIIKKNGEGKYILKNRYLGKDIDELMKNIENNDGMINKRQLQNQIDEMIKGQRPNCIQILTEHLKNKRENKNIIEIRIAEDLLKEIHPLG